MNNQSKSKSELENLKLHTLVVADTGDFKSIIQYNPTDATTNPSLIYKAAQMSCYAHLIDEAINYGSKYATSEKDKLELIMDKLSVNFGLEILKLIPGNISTEVDARLSYDTVGNILRAKRIIKMYEDNGISRDRILIKLASTWEGFQAAKELKKEGIRCNMTLIFSFNQAVVAAEIGVFLISPFVGRIRDWYLKENPSVFVDLKDPSKDPGVISVRNIYNYYKKYDYQTIVMGASFRSLDEIKELVGCDRLTIAPKWLNILQKSYNILPIKLSVKEAKSSVDIPDKVVFDEKTYRYEMAKDAMATTKLAEGIVNFAHDLEKLEILIKKKLYGAKMF